MFEPVLRFIAASDVHVKTEKDCRELKRFSEGMNYAYEYAASCDYDKIDAVYVTGDFANRGKEEEMQNFKEVLDSYVKKETQVVLSLASHEYMAEGEAAAREKLSRIFGMKPDNHKVINGFHFINISTTNGCNFEEPQKKFAEEELKKAFDDAPDAPIFFFQHPHISDTVYGSVNWGDEELYPILMNYPQVIDFSGHSHAPVNDPRSIHQKHFTSLGTGSFSYFELDEFDKVYGTVPPDAHICAQYLIVEADKNNRVRVLPFDVMTGKFFPCERKIDKPSEPGTFMYTNKRYSTGVRPHFHESTNVETEMTEKGIRITFGQADITEDYVDSYKISVRRKTDNHIVRQISVWSGYYFYNMPESLSFDVDSLPNGEYEAEITAEGFWNNTSDNSLRIKFKI